MENFLSLSHFMLLRHLTTHSFDRERESEHILIYIGKGSLAMINLGRHIEHKSLFSPPRSMPMQMCICFEREKAQ